MSFVKQHGLHGMVTSVRMLRLYVVLQQVLRYRGISFLVWGRSLSKRLKGAQIVDGV